VGIAAEASRARSLLAPTTRFMRAPKTCQSDGSAVCRVRELVCSTGYLVARRSPSSLIRSAIAVAGMTASIAPLPLVAIPAAQCRGGVPLRLRDHADAAFDPRMQRCRPLVSRTTDDRRENHRARGTLRSQHQRRSRQEVAHDLLRARTGLRSSRLCCVLRVHSRGRPRLGTAIAV
jgi:hypothetical protein